MYFNILFYAAFMLLGYHLGNVEGYFKGMKSVDFDKRIAQQKINQCLRIVMAR